MFEKLSPTCQNEFGFALEQLGTAREAGRDLLSPHCSRAWQHCQQFREIYRSPMLGLDQPGEAFPSPLILQQPVRAVHWVRERYKHSAAPCSSMLGRRSCPDPHHAPMPCCTDPALDSFLPLCSFLAESPYLTCFHCSVPMPRIFISHLQARRILEG